MRKEVVFCDVTGRRILGDAVSVDVLDVDAIKQDYLDRGIAVPVTHYDVNKKALYSLKAKLTDGIINKLEVNGVDQHPSTVRKGVKADQETDKK